MPWTKHGHICWESNPSFDCVPQDKLEDELALFVGLPDLLVSRAGGEWKEEEGAK